MIARLRALCALPVAVALLAAACSGDDMDATAFTGSAAAPAATTENDTADAATPASEASDAETPDAAPRGGRRHSHSRACRRPGPARPSRARRPAQLPGLRVPARPGRPHRPDRPGRGRHPRGHLGRARTGRVRRRPGRRPRQHRRRTAGLDHVRPAPVLLLRRHPRRIGLRVREADRRHGGRRPRGRAQLVAVGHRPPDRMGPPRLPPLRRVQGDACSRWSSPAGSRSSTTPTPPSTGVS